VRVAVGRAFGAAVVVLLDRFRQVAVALSAQISFAAAAQVLPWQDAHLRSVARIESKRCIGPCAEPNATTRVGTGFIATLPSFSEPVLLTALHVVAGANTVSYTFTLGDGRETITEVIAIDRFADIAVLRLQSMPARPLQFGHLNPNQREVIVFGHKKGAKQLISGEGVVKLLSPKLLSGMPLGSDNFSRISRLGYPDLDLQVVGLEKALTSGDSGAPVFNVDGLVIGMAHGGIPGSDGQISWMIPADRIRLVKPDPGNVGALRSTTLIDVFAAMRVFYSTSTTVTPFGTEPAVAVAMQWPDIDPIFTSYARRLDRKTSRDLKWLSAGRSKLGGGTVIVNDHDAFPAASAQAQVLASCRFEPDDPECPKSRSTERALLEVLSSIEVHVTCFRAEDFDQFLRGRALAQAALELEVPLGDFSEGVRTRRVEWSYDWRGVTASFQIATSFLPYKLGVGRFRTHPEVQSIEDLYGGACRLRIKSSDSKFREPIERLERLLRFGGACLHLQLAPNTHTPVAFTAFLPTGPEPSRGGLWGVLPLGRHDGTPDDLRCF